MERIVECVPNFSEGRNDGVIKEITEVVEGVSEVRMLDVDPGRDTGRRDDPVVHIATLPLDANVLELFEEIQRAPVGRRPPLVEKPRLGEEQ